MRLSLGTAIVLVGLFGTGMAGGGAMHFNEPSDVVPPTYMTRVIKFSRDDKLYVIDADSSAEQSRLENLVGAARNGSLKTSL